MHGDEHHSRTDGAEQDSGAAGETDLFTADTFLVEVLPPRVSQYFLRLATYTICLKGAWSPPEMEFLRRASSEFYTLQRTSRPPGSQYIDGLDAAVDMVGVGRA